MREMNPQSVDGQDGQSDVNGFEDLIVGMSDWAESLEAKGNKRTSGLRCELATSLFVNEATWPHDWSY